MQVWTDQQLTSQIPTAPEKTVLSESYLLCKSEHSKGDKPLIIKSDASSAKSIVFLGKTDADVYTIEKISDLNYIAHSVNEIAPEAYTTLNFNRLTGELTHQSRLPAEVVKILVSVCEKRLDPSECRPRVEKIRGGSLFDCMNTMEFACPRIINSGLPSPLRYQCRKAETRF